MEEIFLDVALLRFTNPDEVSGSKTSEDDRFNEEIILILSKHKE